MPVHCRTYIHFDGARKPENRKNIRGRLMIVFISALDYGCVCFVWGSFQSGSRYSALGNGKRWQCFWGLVWRVSGKNGEEQMREIFDRWRHSRGSSCFWGICRSLGKISPARSRKLWESVLLRRMDTACAFIFGNGLSDTRGGEARCDGAASRFVWSRSREIFRAWLKVLWLVGNGPERERRGVHDLDFRLTLGSCGFGLPARLISSGSGVCFFFPSIFDSLDGIAGRSLCFCFRHLLA